MRLGLSLIALVCLVVLGIVLWPRGDGATPPATPPTPDGTQSKPPTLAGMAHEGAGGFDGAIPPVAPAPAQGEVDAYLVRVFGQAPRKWSSNRTWLDSVLEQTPGGIEALVEWYTHAASDRREIVLARELISRFSYSRTQPSDRKALKDALVRGLQTNVDPTGSKLKQLAIWLAGTAELLSPEDRRSASENLRRLAAVSERPLDVLWGIVYAGLSNAEVVKEIGKTLSALPDAALVADRDLLAEEPLAALLEKSAEDFGAALPERLEATRDPRLVYLAYRMQVGGRRDLDWARRVLARTGGGGQLRDEDYPVALMLLVRVAPQTLSRDIPAFLRARSPSQTLLRPWLDESIANVAIEQLILDIERGDVIWADAQGRLARR